MEIDFHFVHGMVVSHSLDIRSLSSHDQLADIFTKPLSTSRFSLLRTKLNVISLLSSLTGRVKDISVISSHPTKTIQITQDHAEQSETSPLDKHNHEGVQDKNGAN